VSAPVPRFTVITLGVNDMRRSIAFYDALLSTKVSRNRRNRRLLRHRRHRHRPLSLGPARGGRNASSRQATAHDLPRGHTCLELQLTGRSRCGARFRDRSGRDAAKGRASDRLWRLLRIFYRSRRARLGSRGRAKDRSGPGQARSFTGLIRRKNSGELSRVPGCAARAASAWSRHESGQDRQEARQEAG
jgi:hypothetical protein